MALRQRSVQVSGVEAPPGLRHPRSAAMVGWSHLACRQRRPPAEQRWQRIRAHGPPGRNWAVEAAAATVAGACCARCCSTVPAATKPRSQDPEKSGIPRPTFSPSMCDEVEGCRFCEGPAGRDAAGLPCHPASASVCSTLPPAARCSAADLQQHYTPSVAPNWSSK